MFPLKEMFDLVDSGYLNVQRHPEKELYIFNYSRQAQFEKHWNEITLACRGLVLDFSGNLVARCLPKFFNYGELTDEKKAEIGSIVLYEKMDGSYLQVFLHDNELMFSTRGSFTSDQAIRAKEIFYKKYSNSKDLILPGINYIFEVIYPQNKVVVDYGEREELVMLTTISLTGEDKIIDIGIPIVRTYDGLGSIDEILELDWHNHEGFVAMCNLGRFKLKLKEYVRLHSIVTMCSTKVVWRTLRDEGDLKDLVERVPDEFDKWVRMKSDELLSAYADVENKCLEYFKPIKLAMILAALQKGTLDRKFIASYIMDKRRHEKKYIWIIFSMYTGKDYKKDIWNMIEPEFEKPFAMINSEEI